MATDVGEAEVILGDAAFLALINAHRATSGYSALPDMDAVRLAYMGSKTDGMGERWLEHERRKSDAVLAAARSASSPQDGGEALREEDDRFAREFREAQRVAGVHGSLEPYARVLSGRLRQMDKRAKAANRALTDLREQTKLDVGLAEAKTAAAQDRAAAAERERDEARAELVLLDEVCAHYALDESRFLRDEGEPFGSVPIEAGMKARQAGRRYAEREAAELAERRSASERVLADPAADEFDRHDAQIAIECVGYALERIAPLRTAALDPPPRGATEPSGTRDGRGSAADGGEGGGGAE